MTQDLTAILLFSGGLDSLLAAKVLEKQGVKVVCLHFVSPFFGNSRKISHWQKIYNLDIHAFDATLPVMEMLANGPDHGFGKALNPCVDCKILLLQLAREQMPIYGADILATGEVIGQRPMSQRKDAMHLIAREAKVKDILLRPLSAGFSSPLPAERGLLDHSLFPSISGRGRAAQLALAEAFGLAEIPSPAGGCLLTERENTIRYWKILKNWRKIHEGNSTPENLERLAHDFDLAAMGRQVWRDSHWLVYGRSQQDNEKLAQAIRPEDAGIRLSTFPGPYAIARGGFAWSRDLLTEACAIVTSYSPKAVASGKAVECKITVGQDNFCLQVMPDRKAEVWTTPEWEETGKELREERQVLAEKRRGRK